MTSCIDTLIYNLIWYYFQLRSDYDYYLSGKELPGFMALAKDDQASVLKVLP